jgi:hypothetical protein
MPKNIAELPKQRKEFGKAYFGNKEKSIKEEPSVEIEEGYRQEILQKEFEGKMGKEMDALKEIFKKIAEKPAGISRLFGPAAGLVRKIGDYFDQAREWTEQQFAKKELKKGETKENIFESIDANEDKIDLMAFREVLEGTSEAADADVVSFGERTKNGMANLEEKSEESEAGEDIVKETARVLELLDKEAEDAREEFKEEVGELEDEEDVFEEEKEDVVSEKHAKEKTKEIKARLEIKKEKKEEFEEEFNAEKYEKIKDDLVYKQRVLRDTQKYAKQTPATLKKITSLTKEIIALEKAKKKMEKSSQWEDIDVKEFDEEARMSAESKDVGKRLKLRKKVLEDTKKYANPTPAALKKVTQLTKEIMALEKAKKNLEEKIKGKDKKEVMSDEEYEARAKEAEEVLSEDVDVSEFEEPEKLKESPKEKGEAPFGKNVIDESHKKYLEIKEYEEERGNAPEGESADMYLSFSYKDYQQALAKNPKKAEKMEEEMYEKLAMGGVKPKSQGRREAPSGKIKTSIRGER